jgi:hypothetical protein
MLRNLLPSALAILGLFFIALAIILPLFEWQINNDIAKFPPTYEVSISPSPWTTSWGESLDSTLRQNISISNNREICINEEGVNLSVALLPNDKKLENISLYTAHKSRWLVLSSFGIVILSIVYSLWSVILVDHYPVSKIVNTVLIVIGLSCIVIFILMITGPTASSPQIAFMMADNCVGALKLNAILSKIHYEPLIALVLAISVELGAVIIILRRIIKFIVQKMAVG